PGQSFTFTVTGVLGTVCVNTTVCNQGVVEAASGCVATAQLTNQVCTVITTPTPSFTVVKTQTPASPVAGALVTYRLVVTNTGTAVLDSLTVTDTVSAIVTGGIQATPVGFAVLAQANVAGGTWMPPV